MPTNCSRLRSEHRSFMNGAVLRTLHPQGHEEDEDHSFHAGGPYDGDLDGRFNQDKLGLHQFYVQPKRHKDGSAPTSVDTVSTRTHRQ